MLDLEALLKNREFSDRSKFRDPDYQEFTPYYSTEGSLLIFGNLWLTNGCFLKIHQSHSLVTFNVILTRQLGINLLVCHMLHTYNI